MDILRQELRYALRSIRRTPLASTVIVATLAIGIAFVSTFFSLINSAFFRPLRYPAADRTISLTYWSLARRPVEELARITTSLERITLFSTEGGANLVTPAGAFEVQTAAVDSSFFKLLGVAPVMGTLPSAEAIQRREPFVVINERLWRSRFGADSGILGKLIELDGVRRPVVAVMPAWFTYRERAQAWIPLVPNADADSREYTASALLKPGKTIDDVRREADLVGRRLMQVDAKIYRTPRHTYILPMNAMVDRGGGRGAIIALMISLVVSGAIAVLMVACTNVASLMLARVARKRAELGVRSALGASRWQLMRQQILESLLIASMAWAIGVVLAQWGVSLMLSMVPTDGIPGWTTFGIDWRVLAFAGFASLVAVLVFGLWPARVGTRLDLSKVLRGSDNSIAGRDPTRRLHLPVVLELTLSLALFVGAAIALTSLRQLATIDRGMTLDGRYDVRLAIDPQRDTAPIAYTDVISAIRREAASQPILRSVSTTGWFAGLRGDTGRNITVVPTATRQKLDWHEFGSGPRVVSPNYFGTTGIRVLAGRVFDSTDTEASTPVAVVSRSFAQSVWGTDKVIGKTIDVSPSGRRATVIGVTSDVIMSARLVEGRLVPSRLIYFSDRQAQTWPSSVEFIAATTANASTVSSAFTAAAASQGRIVPVFIRTYREEIEGGDALFTRMLSIVLAAFAATGLVLAVMGIYGVVGFAVEQRTREIGVRVALGASPSDVVRHMMNGGMRLVGIGIALGLLCAFVEARILMGLIVGTAQTMALAAIGSAIVFAGIAAVACYLPARRSASLDPLKALRAE
jgi:predicted permease